MHGDTLQFALDCMRCGYENEKQFVDCDMHKNMRAAPLPENYGFAYFGFGV